MPLGHSHYQSPVIITRKSHSRPVNRFGDTDNRFIKYPIRIFHDKSLNWYTFG